MCSSRAVTIRETVFSACHAYGMILAGLEPAVFGSEDQRLIHQAAGPHTDEDGCSPLLRKATLQAIWTQRVSLIAASNRHTSSHQKQGQEQFHCLEQFFGHAVLFSFLFSLMRTNRHRGDSNPCGQRPMDFEPISSATRTQCLVM